MFPNAYPGAKWTIAEEYNVIAKTERVENSLELVFKTFGCF